MVLTAAPRLPLADGSEIATGFWAQEYAVPWQVLAEFGHDLAAATPGGRPAALDPLCFEPQFHRGDAGKKLRSLLESIPDWRAPLAVEELVDTGEEFDAVFFPGGHGPTVDLADSPAVGTLVHRTAGRQRPIAAVCHGAAALLAAGEPWPFAAFRMTCFSPEDELRAGLAGKLPWLLADRLAARGASLTFAHPGTEHVVVDRNLCTGQNPASARFLAVCLSRRLDRR